MIDQKQNDFDFGINYKVTPVTTEKDFNIPTCFQVIGNKNNTVEIENALPDLTNFTVYIKIYIYKEG